MLDMRKRLEAIFVAKSQEHTEYACYVGGIPERPVRYLQS